MPATGGGPLPDKSISRFKSEPTSLIIAPTATRREDSQYLIRISITAAQIDQDQRVTST